MCEDKLRWAHPVLCPCLLLWRLGLQHHSDSSKGYNSLSLHVFLVVIALDVSGGGTWGHWLVFIIIFVFIVCHLSFTLIWHFLALFLMWVVGAFAAFILVTENRLWSFRRNQCYFAIAGMVHICYWCLKICFSGYGKGKRIIYGVCLCCSCFCTFLRNEALLLSAGKKSLFPFKYMYMFLFLEYFSVTVSVSVSVCPPLTLSPFYT